jgi:hypothetical protein
MNSHFLNVTKEEKENILDKHKTLYNGYAVRYGQPAREQPLYTQDFANDKEGVTINSKGEVSKYSNKIYMKESKSVCNECGLYEEVCECGSGYMGEEECNECGNKQVKGIGNKFDYTEQGAGDEYLRVGEEEEDDEEAGFVGKSDLNLGEEEDEEEEYKIIEKVNESLDMFRRFKKYN